MVADFIRRSIEAFAAGNEFTAAFEEIDHRVSVHAGGGTGMEPGVCAETFDDSPGERFTAEASIGLQHHVHDFVGVYVGHSELSLFLVYGKRGIAHTIGLTAGAQYAHDLAGGEIHLGDYVRVGVRHESAVSGIVNDYPDRH